MAKIRCPRCSEEINSLEMERRGTVIYDAVLDRKTKSKALKYVQKDVELDYEQAYDFTCPECNEVVASTDEEALGILRGENTD